MVLIHLLQKELTYLLTCGSQSPVTGIQNDIVLIWITLCGMIKVYWLDFGLHFGIMLSAALLLQVRAEAFTLL